jgi:hypothetical protein
VSYRKLLDGLVRVMQDVRPQYRADGLAVSRRNLAFLHEPQFEQAWSKMAERVASAFPNGVVPDVRWRAHIACWAACQAMQYDGDFVECGVFVGILSATVCHYINFGRLDRSFYLFDTFAGIPDQGLSPEERRSAAWLNRELYFDCYDVAQKNFAAFPNAVLIRGILPDSLAQVADRLHRIAYLSIDLNGAHAEHKVILRLWERLIPGAVVLIDDYGFAGHDGQHAMWDAFAADKGVAIATLPTGQGLLLKPPRAI